MRRKLETVTLLAKGQLKRKERAIKVKEITLRAFFRHFPSSRGISLYGC